MKKFLSCHLTIIHSLLLPNLCNMSNKYFIALILIFLIVNSNLAIGQPNESDISSTTEELSQEVPTVENTDQPNNEENDQPNNGQNDVEQRDYEQIGYILFIFLVLSIVFETAMTTIFNWKFFTDELEGRGLKVPLTIIFAVLVFWSYNLDIIHDLFDVLSRDTSAKSNEPTFWGRFISALLIAGGSDGIFNIFKKLGIRNPTERAERAADVAEMRVIQQTDKVRSIEADIQKITDPNEKIKKEKELKKQKSNLDKKTSRYNYLSTRWKSFK